MRTVGAAVVILSSFLMVSGACKEGAKTGTNAGSPASPEVNTGGLAVTMSFVTGEHSKDSNSQSYSVAVDGESVRYSGPHPPCVRGRCAHGQVDFALDKRLYDEAVAAITRGELTRSISEEKDIGGLGNYVTVDATIELGGKSGTTRIKGMTSAREESGDVLTDEARSRAEAVRMLLIPFRQAGEERLPKK